MYRPCTIDEIKARVFIPIKVRARKQFVRRLNKSLIVKLAYTRMKLDFLSPVPDSKWVEFINTMVEIRNKIEETGISVKNYKNDYRYSLGNNKDILWQGKAIASKGKSLHTGKGRNRMIQFIGNIKGGCI